MVGENGQRTPPTCVLCVGASAGGVDALREFVGALDASFAGTALVVLHVAPSAGSALDRILDRASPLPAFAATDEQPMRSGELYVARPDHHLMVTGGRLRLSHGPRENGVRPAIDPLFRSAASAYRERSIGVVLSGTGDDGTSGLGAIKAAGGTALVQDPELAAYREMPARALEAVDADATGSAAEIAAEAMKAAARFEHPDLGGPAEAQQGGANGLPSEFTCPDCGGTLYEHEDGGVERFVCRVGHSYSSESLLEAQRDNLENVLWTAVRALEERADLARRVKDRLASAGLDRAAARYTRRIDESRQSAEQLRAVLLEPRDAEELGSA